MATATESTGNKPTSQAEHWLSSTKLAGDQKAVTLLMRAMNPPHSKRQPLLALPAAGSEAAAKVMLLLQKGQTPTPMAIETLEISALGPKRLSPSKQAKLDKRRALAQSKKDVINDVGSWGETLATAVADYWREHLTGPHWSEVLSPPFVTWWTEATGLAYVGGADRVPVMLTAKKAGWVAFNRQERSLCPGRRFHSSKFRDQVSRMGHKHIGFRTAAFVAAHRTEHGRSPSWSQIATSTSDKYEVPLFADAADAAAQFQWLATHGWIVLRAGQLHCGYRAEMEFRQRAENHEL